MPKFWSRTAVVLGRRAPLVGVVCFLVTAVLGVGLARLEFATGQDSYLNDDEEVAIDNVAYQELFGGQAMITLFTMDEGTTVVDLFTPANLALLDEIEAELAEADGVEAVVSPRTALQFTQNIVTTTPDGQVTEDPTTSVAGLALLGARDREPDPAAQEIRLADAATTLARLAEVPVAERTFDNPAWIEFLLYDNRGDIRKALRPFFPDETHAQFVTRLVGNADIEAEGVASEAVQDAFADRELENATSVTTGAAVLLKDLNDYLRGGFLLLGGLAVALMVVVLALTFRVRWRLLPLGVILIGVVWAFGLAGHLGIPLSVVTIAGLPVLLGIGIDFAIQVHSRIDEEVQLDRADDPIQETTRTLVPGLIVATVAAALAFLALLLAEVPMIRDFGLLLALGVLVVLVADVVIPTAVLGHREHRRPTTPRNDTVDRMSDLVVKLGSLPRRTVPALIAVSILVFGVGVYVDDGLTLQTDPEEWVDQDSQVIADIGTLRAETGSSSELGIFVEADEIFSDETVTFVHDFATAQLAAYPDDLLTASSLVTTVSFLIELPDTTVLPPTGADVANAFAVAPEGIRRATVAPDGSALNVTFRTGPGSLEERAVVVDEVRDELAALETDSVQATPSGLAVVGVGLLENLESNRTLLTYLALGLVLAWLLLRFRNVVQALFAVVPVLTGVGASALIAGAAGFKLSPLTALGGPLVIAACTEFTTLILTRYLEERRRGLAPQEAADVAAARTGRAFVASALAVIVGVGVLAASSLPLLRDFGIIVSMNVAVALLSALVVLPPLMVWADERGWLLGRRATATAGPAPTGVGSEDAGPGATGAGPGDERLARRRRREPLRADPDA